MEISPSGLNEEDKIALLSYNTHMPKKKKINTKKNEEKKQQKAFYEELIGQMLTLATSGLGLAAALAWNTTIQQFVKEFIEPQIPGSGLISQFIYAVIVTCFAVVVTYQLSRIASRFQKKD